MPNIPLNALGIGQVSALSKRLVGVDRVISSPVQRARETAEILRTHGHPQPESMVLFTEFDFGSWTGKSFTELNEDPDWQNFNESRESVRAPDGESMHDVQQRAAAGLRQLVREEPDQTLAIVSHADVIRALILQITGTPVRNFWRFHIGPASITELICGPEGDERIVRLNDGAHLEHLA